jgi:hypothetical protein
MAGGVIWLLAGVLANAAVLIGARAYYLLGYDRALHDLRIAHECREILLERFFGRS